MATEVYSAPAPQQPTKIYLPPDDQTGSTIYEDPNKVTFEGNMLLSADAPTVVVT
jgi:hypothetical protein